MERLRKARIVVERSEEGMEFIGVGRKV